MAADSKKNIPLLISLAIPVVMILLVAASIYLPRRFAPMPQHDFVYLLRDPYAARYEYVVRNGRLEQQELEYPPDVKQPVSSPRLARYNVTTNTVEEISFADAQELHLDAAATSPDGFEVTYGNQETGLFPFFVFAERDYRTLYLAGHRVAHKLNISLPQDHGGSFQFLGWVVGDSDG